MSAQSWTALALVAPAVTPTQLPAARIGEDVVVMGALQRPIGEELTLRGKKRARGPLQDSFVAESVNGQPLPPETYVEIDGITAWPDGTAATLRGCEVGTLRFLHPGETNFGPADSRWKGPHQMLFVKFVPNELPPVPTRVR